MLEKNNLATISERTGYSVSTVSRVLSGKAGQYRISQAAVDRITREARRCGYRPNLVAQTLRTRQSQTVGLVVPGIDNPFFATLASIIIAELDARGYRYYFQFTLTPYDGALEPGLRLKRDIMSSKLPDDPALSH